MQKTKRTSPYSSFITDTRHLVFFTRISSKPLRKLISLRHREYFVTDRTETAFRYSLTELEYNEPPLCTRRLRGA